MQKTITPIDNTLYIERNYDGAKIEETINGSMKAQKMCLPALPRPAALCRLPPARGPPRPAAAGPCPPPARPPAPHCSEEVYMWQHWRVELGISLHTSPYRNTRADGRSRRYEYGRIPTFIAAYDHVFSNRL